MIKFKVKMNATNDAEIKEYRKGSDILATIFVLFFGRFSGKWALSALSDSWNIDLMFFVKQKVT